MQPFPTAELGKALGGSEPPAALPAARAGQVPGAESCFSPPRPSSPLPRVWGDSPSPLPHGFPAVKTALLALSYSLFNMSKQNKWGQPRRSHWKIPHSEESREQPLLPISLRQGSFYSPRRRWEPGGRCFRGRALFFSFFPFVGGLALRRESASLRAELCARRLPALTPSSPPLPDLARRSHPVYIKSSFSSREIKKEQGICFTMTYVQFSHPRVDLGL